MLVIGQNNKIYKISASLAKKRKKSRYLKNEPMYNFYDFGLNLNQKTTYVNIQRLKMNR